jgi:hypothetical protein
MSAGTDQGSTPYLAPVQRFGVVRGLHRADVTITSAHVKLFVIPDLTLEAYRLFPDGSLCIGLPGDA